MGPSLTRVISGVHPLKSRCIKGLAEWILTSPSKRNIIVLAGAGASTSAGIPDFRSPGTGLYDNLQKYNLPTPESIFNLQYFSKSPDAFYDLARDLWPGVKGYKPTLTHHFIAMLERKGRLLRCFTQNIDGLEKLAGLPSDRVVAAHGSFDAATCITTGRAVPVEELRKAVLAGKEGPDGWQALREKHGGLVKPDIVFFGENLPGNFFNRRRLDFQYCHLLLVIGTSLSVHPFASLPYEPPSACIKVLLNREDVVIGGFSEIQRAMGFEESNGFDISLLGSCDDQVQLLAKQLGWEKELADAAG
mmetsp:Transcript_36003/g.67028  ORF Transcript_36003/g.67028 Transcript_36003/m.67028 type:complete len:304 (-) Transcript_36003:389-1300(-)